MPITKLTASQLSQKLQNKEISATEVIQAHLNRINNTDQKINAFLHTNTTEALNDAKKIDKKRASGENLHPLAGIPIAIKDLVCTKGQPTTAASKILQNYIPPYDATIIKKIRNAGMIILGKTNLDEFAMGSSTEHSAYGPTKNPWDTTRIPGGSGGGSAAALAAYQTPLAIGTDTGGSIRQPAAVTATVGVKPSYGAISRYGIIALASSLDQPGPAARNVLDTALLHEVITGHDPLDATSLKQPKPQLVAAACLADIKGLKIGIIKELNGTGYQTGVKKRFDETINMLTSAGAEITEISCPNFQYSLGAYYLIMSSEASSNLARYDTVRYGKRYTPQNNNTTIEQVMATSRANGFGTETKRRIILGTYALSAGYHDAYYGTAQKVRTLIQQDFNQAFNQVDLLISPTTPTTAFKLGEKLTDPLQMYLNDIATIPANLAGIPGMSLPNGLAEEDNLPTAVQLLAPHKADALLYQVASVLETLYEAKWGQPILNQAPKLDKNE